MDNKNQFLYFRLSGQYLHVVEAVTSELLKQGNLQVVISDHQITENEFHESTKWSDYNIAEPILFNLYHGIELTLKGYLKSINSDVSKYGHKIDNLFAAFSTYFISHKTVIDLLRKYIGNNSDLIEPLRAFFVENKITVSKYYDALRYPTDKEEQTIYNYYELKGLGKQGLTFFGQLNSDVDTLQREIVKYWTPLGR
jgi:hypothetical protein